MEETDTMIEFTAADRCDRCGAQAHVVAKHDDFGELLFCVHHARETHGPLEDEGWEVTGDLYAIEAMAFSDYKAPV